MLTKEEEAELVEFIQRITATKSWEERIRIAEAWRFMSSEVHRMHDWWLRHSQQPQQRQLQLKLD